ncbi:cupin [Spirosoma foliorum]|uniref:Cupin n=1 Tax=Spirosoma foliorum TaxID=2710596 RepID=A0A7G5GPC9_9BACT|nr:cupin [Spirosoma foliorum]QMW00721.1 cupin [Spirosoma foliorum]
MHIETYSFSDDGVIPNNRLPVILYRQVEEGNNLSAWLENRFKANNWTNNWRDIILPYDHFHSTTHEVLGVGYGSVSLQLGGKRNGLALTVSTGDVLIIPAGVGHRALTEGTNYEIVGGYPGGLAWDLMKGNLEERTLAFARIPQLALPETDPVFGTKGALLQKWNAV